MNENSPRPVFSNLLLFSSDGHQGFGGMDIFLARRKSTGDTTLVNIGIPFNSSRDDMFPDISNHRFMWSSNKNDGPGGFDIYYTPIESIMDFTSLVSVVNIDARRTKALSPPRELRDPSATYVTIVNTGEVSFEQLPPDQQQAIDALALGRDADVSMLSSLARAQIDALVSDRKAFLLENTQERIEVQLKDVQLAGAYEIMGSINCRYCLTDPVVELLDSLGDPLHKAVPSKAGAFRFSNLAPGQTVFLRVPSQEGSAVYFEDVLAEFQADHTTFTFIPIYFDLAENRLRPESVSIIEQVGDFLKSHPDIHLEIIAHADNTGSAAYNDILSRKRGETVLLKLLDQGVSTTSIMVRARGYKDPTASNDTPLGRQLNRRVEFQFSGPSYEIEHNYQYCFTREKMNGSEFNKFLKSQGLSDINAMVKQESVRAWYPVLTTPEVTNNEILECSPSHPGK
jgi:outer membrane protein OmpA-like peptidoglycan-associated protein